LGDYIKPQIKKMAAKINLPNLKTESQDICFMANGGKIEEHNEFLKKYLRLTPGPIKKINGETIGTHEGLPLYTLGQRKGIAIGGTGPYYVADKDIKNNILYVTEITDQNVLLKDSLVATNVNWISGDMPDEWSGSAVIRYRHKPISCKIKKISQDTYEVIFSSPERAITSGQSVVFYDKDELMGGGIIQ
jgi:tRNA-specific 2-thiouridylase